MPEEGILTRTYSARDQVQDCPDFTRAKNKLSSWDKYFMPRHKSIHNIIDSNNPSNHRRTWCKKNSRWYCDMMGGIRFCRCGCQSEDPLVCFGAKLTQRLHARSPTRPEEDKGRKVPGTVGRREQSRERQSRDESRAERRPVNRSQKGDC